MDETKEFINMRNQRHPGAITSNQKDMLDYIDELSVLYDDFNLNLKKGKGLKILTKQQMFSGLPKLLAQIQAGNNSSKLKNDIRQIIYSLYRSKALTETVYNNLIKVIKKETFFMNTKNSKTNEQHMFKYNLIDKLN